MNRLTESLDERADASSPFDAPVQEGEEDSLTARPPSAVFSANSVLNRRPHEGALRRNAPVFVPGANVMNKPPPLMASRVEKDDLI